MEILAAVLNENFKPFQLLNINLEDPRDDEVLVRIRGVGMCHTDLVVRDNYYPVPLPVVLGHEGAGVVERVGKRVTKVATGDHVVLTYAFCGQCRNCQRGMPGYCLNLFGMNFAGQRLDGSKTLTYNGTSLHGSYFGQSSFATYSLAYERNVVKVPKEAPLEILGPLGCGIQTGAGAVINALKPGAGSSIAVFGAGAVGLSAVMAARVVGCTTIVAVDIKDERLRLAKELGATHTIHGKQENAAQKITELSGGGVDYSIEATGVPAILRQSVDCLNVTGVCGVIGVAPLGTEVSLDVNSIMFGRTVRGIIEGDSVPDVFIPQMIELHRQGRFPFDRLVKKFPLEEINQVAEAAAKGDVLKPVLLPSA